MSVWIADDLPSLPAPGGSFKRGDESIPTSVTARHQGSRSADAAPEASSLDAAVVDRLHVAQAEHAFWDNRLFRACAARGR